MNPVTYLVSFIRNTMWDAIPIKVQRHTEMTLFNYLSVGIGGSQDNAVDIALKALDNIVTNRNAPVLGRCERVDVYSSALVNGIASHVDDYDDTHLETVIHPASPVVSSALALAESIGASGEQFLTAITVGCEVALRIGMSVSPSHYDEGWHITGTCGVFGATAAAGRLLSLTDEQMSMALGLAATQASGVREAFGTMTKSLHSGLAAQNGIIAAFLAKNGLSAPMEPFEGTYAFPRVYAERFESVYVSPQQGQWELLSNSFKPYPCGVVIHPAADAAIQLHRDVGGDWRQVENLVLRAHPLVLELTGRYLPLRGLEGKFSIYYCVASSLIHGFLRVVQFSDSMVTEPEVLELQQKVKVETDDSMPRDACSLTAYLGDGRQIQVEIPHATGSLQNPMSYDFLMDKAKYLIDPMLGGGRADALIRAVSELSNQHSVCNLIDLATKPAGEGCVVHEY